MKRKKRRFKSGFIITLLIVVIVIVFLSNRLHFKLAHIFQIERSSYIDKNLDWNSDLNLKQGFNQCASYSAMAYIYIKNQKILDPKIIDKNITAKLKNNYTLPWGIVEFLKTNNLESRIYWHGLMTKKSREMWLKTKVTMGFPVIIITGNQQYLHYVTILGFTNNSFHIYDSLVNLDKNGDKPGNIDVPTDTLIKRWKKAHFNRIPFNLAISY